MDTKKRSFSARDISLIAVIAALYAVATVALPFACTAHSNYAFQKALTIWSSSTSVTSSL